MKFTAYTTKPVQEILTELKATDKGLNKQEVARRWDEYGPNEIEAREIHWWRILFRQFESPFIYILLVASLIAFLLNEIIEASMILAFVGINTTLSFLQEYHSEKNLKLLKKYLVPRAKVRREGQEIMIDSRDLVPGDFVIVEAGDKIPADLRFLEENNLTVDEEILTGESAPVNKISTEMKEPAAEIYQAKNIGFSGTTVAGGKGFGVVLATGKNTALGGIAKLAVETVRISSFEKGILKFSKFILRLILITIVIVFLANILIKGPGVNVAELVIFSIALAISVIPEPLPVVTTVSLSSGALKLAKSKVVVKRLSAVEDLGSIEVLCSDKTGTLTENKLTVDKIFSDDKKQCVFYAAAAASFWGKKKGEPTDAFDLALYNQLTPEEKEKIKKYERVTEIPFDPARKRNSVLVKYDDQCELIVRGAPEIIFDLCTELGSEKKKSTEQWMTREGKLGRRVIAVATKKTANKNHYFPDDEKDDLKFIGVISFVDPIKKTASHTVAQAKKLGVKIKILTGDRKEVAGAVAYKIGLIGSPDEVLVGDEFDKMPDPEKHKVVEKYSVFARVSPEHKYKIIQLLQEKNEVGFLGEGINDAPALKIANVAIVVQSAADIARDAADVVLLKKSLEVIVDGIQEGRKIFANITKYIKLTLASNFGNFLAVATASLLLSFLPMLAVQILLLNLLSDFPMIAIATDTVDADELKRPKSYNVREIILLATLLGVVSTVFDFMFFGLFYRISPGVLQTNWFIGSLLTELVLVFSIRTKFFFLKAKRPSWILSGLIALAAVIAIVLPYTNFGADVFSFVKPQIYHLWLILTLVAGYFVATESIKLIYYRAFNHKTI